MDDSLKHALEAHQRGDLATADRHYLDVLAAEPDHYDALRLRGVLMLQRGEMGESRALLARATELRPGDPEAWVNLATLEQMSGDLNAAIAVLDRALAADPTLAAAHNNHGNVLLLAGRLQEAEAAYQKALNLEPGDPGLLLNLAGSLHAQGKLADAEARCREALARDGTFAAAEAMLAAILAEGGDPKTAESMLRSALLRNPGNAEWRYSLAQVVESQGRWRDALVEYRAAAAARPEWFQPVSAAIFLARRIGDWSQLAADSSRYHEAVSAHVAGASPFIALFDSDDRLLQREAGRLWTAQVRQSVAGIASSRDYTYSDSDGDRITVGYLSSGFGSHATAALTAGVFEHHDHERFRTIAYSLLPDDGTALAQRVRGSFDTFHDAYDWAPGRIADQIHQDGVDVLVDLNGFTDGGRPAVLALSPAPIQISWLAYPGTMGGLAHYLVADPRLIHDGEDADYDEAVIRMPSCYQPTDPSRAIAPTPTRAEMGLPDDAVVLACHNNGYKIDPAVFGDWLVILNAVPGSVLWLLDSSPDRSFRENLRRFAAEQGADPERLVFCGKAAHAEYLARYRIADLVLDTFPYTAHTTASDALFAGVPLVTREGNSFASRVAGSILADLDLQDLITTDANSFRERVIALATDQEARAQLRDRIADRAPGGKGVTASLWDPVRYATVWESVLDSVHRRRLDGEPIAGMDVQIGQ